MDAGELFGVWFVIGGGRREDRVLCGFVADRFWAGAIGADIKMVIEMADGILTGDLGAPSDAHEKVDKYVDLRAPVSSRLAHAVSLQAQVIRGGGEIRASTGDGDDAQSGAMSDLLLSFHEGLQKKSKIISKLGVVLERLRQNEEIERSSEWHVIDVKNMLDLFDVAVVTVDEG